MGNYQTPGVYIKEVVNEPATTLRTGVPVFLGLMPTPGETSGFLPIAGEDICLFKSNLTVGNIEPRLRIQQTYQDSDPSAPNRSFRLSAPESAPDHDNKPDANATKVPRAALAKDGATDHDNKPDAHAEVLRPGAFTTWPQFERVYGAMSQLHILSHAVRGFFENGGLLCFVQIVTYGNDIQRALEAGLETLEAYGDYDLICAPDIAWLCVDNQDIDITALQRAILNHCTKLGDRFAILDAQPNADQTAIIAQRQALGSENGALYYPWIAVADGPLATEGRVPPCGHVAGVFARSDRQVGVHKAPANEVLEGVIRLEQTLSDARQAPLNEAGINCLRSFPRRGIRVWGARTLSHTPAWRFVNTRRIFLTTTRWIERNLAYAVFEPNDHVLWGAIVRDLTAYFTDLVERGAFVGRSPAEAFYVKCDAETNPLDSLEFGQVVTEIGLALDPPTEFIVVRILHGSTGARVIGP